ncbi:MAG TPA: tetratricopeptide repeat protein [Nitrosopumilaceae archaeon]|jgi:tetratricopeptide (TPR) repeat protein
MKKLFKKKPEEKVEETSLTDADYNRNKLFKKGINLMADEKLEEAAQVFEQVLRIDPKNVDALLKLGYARFHLDDHSDALRVYDKILDIDVTNAEAWNLKGLVHYEQKNYAKALDCVEKSIESEPTYGMAWYNKACFLSLLNQIPESIEALKRAIEIDVKNAKRAVKDKDFLNVRVEEGFKRIIEVVVLESIRQGYHTIGAIVWTTFLDKADALDALSKLIEKGLVVKHQKQQGFSKIDTYDMVPEMAKKVGTEKKGLLGTKQKRLPITVRNLKEISQAIQIVKSSIEEEDVEKTIDNFDLFIDPTKYGQQMIEQFFEQHREIRLWKIRLKDRGVDYLHENKQKMLDVFDNIEATVTQKLRSEVSQN